MVRDGIPFVAVPAALAILPMLFGLWVVAVVLIAVAAFMAFFFRDPRREIPRESGIIVAPADGRVTLDRSGTTDANSDSLISIFLSPLDVHVNRAPIAGTVTAVDYQTGKFLMATDERARDLNERNTLTIEGAEITVKCTQIAGILARRIVCWKRKGERVECGERFGMIKFGSRTDVSFPNDVEVLVKKGVHVRGGVTIIGRIKS
ncbi:MAG: phosphatidylserine decarboxylase [Acidobacteria bacterium 13_1_20CM_3_53_8]|nr:MAG: phosphatidylserine decarboxylase [Acidobacteria bacterium 13_1_20CM_3_53_8]